MGITNPTWSQQRLLRRLWSTSWTNSGYIAWRNQKMPFIQPREILFFLAREPTRSNLPKQKHHFNVFCFQLYDGRKHPPKTGTRGNKKNGNEGVLKSCGFFGTKVMDPTVLHLHAGTDAQRYQWPCLRGALHMTARSHHWGSGRR